MAEVELIINIIESIHKKKKRADLETIYKEDKETNLSKEDIEVLFDKLCENDVLRKVKSHGKCGFCFVAKASEVQKNQNKDNVSDISGNNDWNTDDFFLKQNLHNLEKFNIYTDYLKGLCDLEDFWRLR